MEYSKVIAVTGLPGLFELLSSKADGAIVRALEDKSTRFVSSRIHNFSHLESIEIYTVRDNVNLVEILKAMDASKEALPDEKDNSALKAYFGKVYPDLDFERVYTSDLKKMVKWFTVLRNNQIELKLSEVGQEEEEGQEDGAEDSEQAAGKTAKPKTAQKPKEEAKSKEEPKPKAQAKAAVKEEGPATKVKKAAKAEATPANEKGTKASAVKEPGGKKEVTAKESPSKKSGGSSDKTKKKATGEKPKKTAKKK
jgi:hypothetical protein